MPTGFFDKSLPFDERAIFGDKLLLRLNRSRGNLIGGDASTNRSIQQLRDIARIKNDRLVARMARRVTLQDRYWQRFGVPNPFEARPNIAGKPASSTGDL